MRNKNSFQFTEQEWEELEALFENVCARCGQPETPPNTLAADHIIPRSKGGHGRISNIQPLCRSCNSAKRDRSSDDFRLWLWAIHREYSAKLQDESYLVSRIHLLLPLFETLPATKDWAWLWRLSPTQTEVLKWEIANLQRTS